jgi:hypothetical protein
MSEGDGMANIELWSYCPECGMVWQDARRICEINGAGSETIPVDPTIGEELLRYGNQYAGAVEERDALRERVDQLEQDLAASRIGLWVEPPHSEGQ